MFTTKIKFGLLAAACLIAGAPVIGNLQRQAAPKPEPRFTRRFFEFDEQNYQRAALRHWLMSQLGAASVADSDGSSTRIRVAMAPNTTRSSLLTCAQSIVGIMNYHFRRGKDSSITEVDLQSDQAKFSIVPDRSGAPDDAAGWRILEQGRAAR